MNFLKGTATLLAIATLSACVSHPSLEHPDYMVPAFEPLAELPQEERGSSLYSPITEVALFEDVKGYRRGDIINVLLAERTAAQKSSGTNVSKSNEATVQNPTLGGAEREQLGTIWSRPFNLGFGLDSEQSFTGASGSNQSNTLSGSIAVTVVEELPGATCLCKAKSGSASMRGMSLFGFEALFVAQTLPRPTPCYPPRSRMPELLMAALGSQKMRTEWVGCRDSLIRRFSRFEH